MLFTKPYSSIFLKKCIFIINISSKKALQEIFVQKNLICNHGIEWIDDFVPQLCI